MLNTWISNKKSFYQCLLPLHSLRYELKKLLKVLSPPIFFLHSHLKPSLKALFSSMLSLHCKHVNYLFLIHFYLCIFRSNFIHFFVELPLFTLCEFANIFFQPFLTLNTPCIAESCIEIKIKLIFYFHTYFWCLKRFYEGL